MPMTWVVNTTKDETGIITSMIMYLFVLISLHYVFDVFILVLLSLQYVHACVVVSSAYYSSSNPRYSTDNVWCDGGQTGSVCKI